MRLLGPFSAFLAAATFLFSSPQPTLKHEGSTWTLSEQGTLTLDAAGSLLVKAAGNIRIRGVNSPQATYKLARSLWASREMTAAKVWAALSQYPLTTARQGGNAVIQAAPGPFATTLEITVPRALASTLVESQAGDIDVSDLYGSLSAGTSGGRINAGHIGADVDLRSAGGSIIIGVVGGGARAISGGGSILAGEIRGDAFLETGGSDIVLRKAGGRVRASTAGGSIQIGEARGPVVANTFGGPIQVGSSQAMRCESASGSIVARFLPGRRVLDSFLSTGAGDITVWIPSNLQISIRAQNEGTASTATVVSDFPGLHARSAGSAVLAEVQINGGGRLLQVAGNGGRIYIRKGKNP